MQTHSQTEVVDEPKGVWIHDKFIIKIENEQQFRDCAEMIIEDARMLINRGQDNGEVMQELMLIGFFDHNVEDCVGMDECIKSIERACDVLQLRLFHDHRQLVNLLKASKFWHKYK